jgi:hypothetical protein
MSLSHLMNTALPLNRERGRAPRSSCARRETDRPRLTSAGPLFGVRRTTEALCTSPEALRNTMPTYAIDVPHTDTKFDQGGVRQTAEVLLGGEDAAGG